MLQDVARARPTAKEGKTDRAVCTHHQQVGSPVRDPVEQPVHDAEIFHQSYIHPGTDSVACQMARDLGVATGDRVRLTTTSFWCSR